MSSRDNSWSARQQVRDADVVGGGGDEGTRTPDPRDANAVLFRLSYIPTRGRSHALGAIAGRECSTAPGAGGQAGQCRRPGRRGAPYGPSQHRTDVLSLACLLYTSDAADDLLCVDLGGRRIINKK